MPPKTLDLPVETDSDIGIDIFPGNGDSSEQDDPNIYIWGSPPKNLTITNVDLGKGNCAPVTKWTYTDESEKVIQVALKTVKLDNLNNVKQMMQEIILLPLLADCKHIVRAHFAFFQSRAQTLSVALECMDLKSLDAIIKIKGKVLSEKVLRVVAFDCVRGLLEVHTRGIVHRDMKPGNILVSGEGDVKIADFGLARELKADEIGGINERVGTVKYMSPEQQLGEAYAFPADIWGLGLSLLNLAIGNEKLCGSNNSLCADVFKIKALQGKIEDHINDAEALSEEFRSFLRCCCFTDKSQRWCAKLLLKHPFLAGVTDDDNHDIKEGRTELKSYFAHAEADANNEGRNKKLHPGDPPNIQHLETVVNIEKEIGTLWQVAPPTRDKTVVEYWCSLLNGKPNRFTGSPASNSASTETFRIQIPEIRRQWREGFEYSEANRLTLLESLKKLLSNTKNELAQSMAKNGVVQSNNVAESNNLDVAKPYDKNNSQLLVNLLNEIHPQSQKESYRAHTTRSICRKCSKLKRSQTVRKYSVILKLRPSDGWLFTNPHC